MCFGQRSTDSETKKSREIDALIHRDEKVMQRQVKLLLLGERFSFSLAVRRVRSSKLIAITSIGAGESGKSTILKQMRLIYTKDGFSKNEKEEWRVIIFNNILEGLRKIIEAMQDFSIDFEYENTSVSRQLVTGSI